MEGVSGNVRLLTGSGKIPGSGAGSGVSAGTKVSYFCLVFCALRLSFCSIILKFIGMSAYLFFSEILQAEMNLGHLKSQTELAFELGHSKNQCTWRKARGVWTGLQRKCLHDLAYPFHANCIWLYLHAVFVAFVLPKRDPLSRSVAFF